jgi:hypothetical protein
MDIVLNYEKRVGRKAEDVSKSERICIENLFANPL